MATPWSGVALVVAALLADPLGLFKPTVELDEREQRALNQGQAVVRTLSVPSRHIGVFVAMRVSADANRLARWLDQIEAFKRSEAVSEIGRFSNPPRLSDLDALSLDPADVEALRECTPGHCGLLFTPEEIQRLVQPFGRSRQWQEDDLRRALREVLLERAQAYLRSGRIGEPPPAFVQQQWPGVARAIESQPAQLPAGATTFLYWEKVRLGGKPTVTITHVTVLRETGTPACALVAISRHVFSTRHISDGWSVLTLVPPYFTYVYQARIDRLGGFFGGIVRHFVERELKARAGNTLVGLRDRLEGGDPPQTDPAAAPGVIQKETRATTPTPRGLSEGAQVTVLSRRVTPGVKKECEPQPSSDAGAEQDTGRGGVHDLEAFDTWT
jgi:hypothetical protein